MNAQSLDHEDELSWGMEWATAWVVGLLSLTLWAIFTPYVALEQARQLALCLASLCGVCVLSLADRVRKKISLIRELSWPGAEFGEKC